jgi:hypothetical protein
MVGSVFLGYFGGLRGHGALFLVVFMLVIAVVVTIGMWTFSRLLPLKDSEPKLAASPHQKNA